MQPEFIRVYQHILVLFSLLISLSSASSLESQQDMVSFLRTEISSSKDVVTYLLVNLIQLV